MGKTLLDLTLRADLLKFLDTVAMTDNNVNRANEASKLYQRLNPRWIRKTKNAGV